MTYIPFRACDAWSFAGPFLWIGIISALHQESEKVQHSNILLNSSHRKGNITGLNIFMHSFTIPSIPGDLFMARHLTITASHQCKHLSVPALSRV